MIPSLKLSGLHCSFPIICWISLRIPIVVNPGKIFHSNSISCPSLRFKSSKTCCLNTIECCSSRIQQDRLPSFPNRAQSRRRRRLWQWNIDELDCAISLSTPRTLENKHACASGFCLTTDQLLCFPEKLSRCFPKDGSLQISNSCHSLFRGELLLVQTFHRIARLSSIDLPDHGDDGFRIMDCVCGDSWR